jgi:hypothetical protein
MQNGSVGDSYIENVQAAKFKGHNRHEKSLNVAFKFTAKHKT